MSSQLSERTESTRLEEASLVLPDDEYNRRLLENVRPDDWVNPEPAGRYNIVIIGAGTAGLVTAVIAAGVGRRWRSSSAI